MFRTARSAPRGTTRARSTSCAGFMSTRHPATTRNSDRYPVFYLLHGAGDEDSGWSTIGRAGFILDNLLAAGKARPMIVVMPNGSLPRPANFPRPAPGTTPSPEFRAAMEAFQNRFTDELLEGHRSLRREDLPRRSRAARTGPSPGCRWAEARRSGS